MMISEIKNLIEQLKNSKDLSTEILPWGSPIISFGNIKISKIATLGINPSNREFVDTDGNELTGNQRRFHTLKSLNLQSWSDVREEHILKILDSCDNYFSINPYDTWFKKLDFIIGGSSLSFYFPSMEACHLDLIPFATSTKWSEISAVEKALLLKTNANFLGNLLAQSSIKVLILNGQTVVDNFEKITNKTFKKLEVVEWALTRKSVNNIKGYSYTGTINKVGSVILKNEILILGYNHNIQSSFGVTKTVTESIRSWVSSQIKKQLYET